MISTAKEFVELLSSNEVLPQRRLVLEEASEHTWFEILNTYPEYTISVIRNKTIPLSILRHLSSHPDPSIRWEVATKRKLDRELFESLANDPDEDVRIRIAYNKKTPYEILERLSRDQSLRVAEVARSRLTSGNE